MSALHLENSALLRNIAKP